MRLPLFTPTSKSQGRQTIYNAIFPLAVDLLAVYVNQPFVLPVLWAAILATATWPLYLRIGRIAAGATVIAALATTAIVATVFMVPVILLSAAASRQEPVAAHLKGRADRFAIAPPVFFLPAIGWVVDEAMVGEHAGPTAWPVPTVRQSRRACAQLSRAGFR